MKTLRRRAVAKAVGAKYFVREDGCLCLRYYVSGLGNAEEPWYPAFPENKFLKHIHRLDSRKGKNTEKGAGKDDRKAKERQHDDYAR